MKTTNLQTLWCLLDRWIWDTGRSWAWSWSPRKMNCTGGWITANKWKWHFGWREELLTDLWRYKSQTAAECILFFFFPFPFSSGFFFVACWCYWHNCTLPGKSLWILWMMYRETQRANRIAILHWWCPHSLKIFEILCTFLSYTLKWYGTISLKAELWKVRVFGLGGNQSELCSLQKPFLPLSPCTEIH